MRALTPNFGLVARPMPATLYGFEPFMISTLRLCRLSLTFHSHQAHNATRLPGLKPKTAPATFPIPSTSLRPKSVFDQNGPEAGLSRRDN